MSSMEPLMEDLEIVQEDQNLQVTVTGGTAGANMLVAGAIRHALLNAGFRDVNSGIPGASLPVREYHTSKFESLLDVCEEMYPEVFATPVFIKQEHPSLMDIPNKMYVAGGMESCDIPEEAILHVIDGITHAKFVLTPQTEEKTVPF